MHHTKTLENCIAYIEGLASRYAPLRHFGFGYNDEQGDGGASPYPQLWLEAEVQTEEVNPGLARYHTAFLLLDKPEQQGTQPGTRAERAIMNATLEMVHELLEQMRQEGVLQAVRQGSALWLAEFNDDCAYGWRVELSFEAVKAIDRADMKTRFAPLA